MSRREYDVIVVGASFAGLAVARELRGDVLLLDRHEVGAVQTSACGTPLWVPESLGVADSVVQVHQRLLVRSSERIVVYNLDDVPFCTFDYRKFCRGLLAQSRARFLRASVIGVQGDTVATTEGRFTAPILIDCSGWRQAIVNGGRSVRPVAGTYSFGLETPVQATGEDLCLWFEHARVPGGLAWVFPVGPTTLVGLGSYRGDSKLRAPLARLVEDLGLEAGPHHGTYFPNRLLSPTCGSVFAVGDSAGQCLPLTAEGIRPALYFGTECGRIVQRILDGLISLARGLEQYRRLVARYRRPYRLLRLAQHVAAHAPTRTMLAIVHRAYSPRLRRLWWPRYGLFGRLDVGIAAWATPPAGPGGSGRGP
jgi:menaquinone-9 beta-reductase